MSKKENEFYYSFTSPPVQSSSSSSTIPSAPPSSNSELPPSYDDATVPSSAISPPPNKRLYDGYVLDPTVTPPFNPNLNVPHNTSDYEAEPMFSGTGEEASAPLLENRYEEYENFSGRPAPPSYSIYQAKYKTVKDGVISRDKHLNEDSEALLQFLYQHNNKPRMIIHFYGYHEETYWTTTSTRNSDGELVEERQPTTRRIDDFIFDVDVSSDVSDVCQGVYILPDPNTGEVKSLKQLCTDYVHEHNVLKELQLTKEVNWDYNGLTRALTTAIRNSGFYENIEISFKMKNHEVVVKTDHKLSRWIDNKALRFIFFISCLWIFVWPVIWFYRKKFGHSTLKSSWNMNISERDWYSSNVQHVLDSCRGSNVFYRGALSNRPSNFSVQIF